MVCGSHAWAQDDPTEQKDATVIVPPRPIGSTEVHYPEGETDESRVLLHLVVTLDGRVSEATAVSGSEPFATIAREAALHWSFEPALRNGHPVTARIRFEVRFVPPTPTEDRQEGEEAVEETSLSKPGEASLREGEPLEPRAPVTVFVRGEKPPPSVRTMTRAEVRQLPGAFGDPFRAIEVLPGVTPMVSGIPFFFVRGAPPGNVGYYLDGIRVPLLYHVALGPSVIHPAIVSRVDLHPGGYPAQYGRFAGGIVAAETTDPALELRGEANIRLVDAGALVEEAWSDGWTRATVGGRYSYTAAALSLFSPDVALQYWDYQLRGSRKLNEKDSVGVFAFGAYDFLGEKLEDRTDTVLATQFHRIDLRFDRRSSDAEQVRVAVTAGLDRTAAGEEDRLYLRDRLVAGRLEWKRRTEPGLWLRAGSDVAVDVYDVVVSESDDEEFGGGGDEFDGLFPSRTDVVFGGYVSAGLRVAPALVVTPGIRADLYHSDGATAVGVDPRLSVEVMLGKGMRLEQAVGLVHQPPSFAVPIPGFQIGGIRGGLQRAFQSSVGIHSELPEDVMASLTVFQNVFFNMSDSISLMRVDVDEIDPRSLGRTVGLEVYAKRRLTHRIGGFVSYTLSRSTRSYARYQILSSYDRTHVFNAAAAFDLGRQWRGGARFTYYSGFPGELTPEALWVGRTPERSPGFYRTDMRLEKRWRINEAGAWWALVLEVLNATLRKEVVEYECGIEECTAQRIGPVTIPSIGAEAAF